MGDVENCINEEGTLKVIQKYKLRFPFSRLWSNDQQRHPVVRWSNCSRFWPNWQNVWQQRRWLQIFFIFIFILILILILTLIAIRTFDEMNKIQTPGRPFGGQSWIYSYWLGIIFLAVFTAGFVIGMLMKTETRTASPSPPQKVEMSTVSGLVQQEKINYVLLWNQEHGAETDGTDASAKY